MKDMQAALLLKIVGTAVQALTSAVGIRLATQALDAIRQKMVDEGRGPSDAELDTLFNDINARSKRIQEAGE